MMSRFKPTWMVENIYDLTPATLKDAGIKAVLTDLDNTLIAWNNPDGTPELKAWLNLLAAHGIQLIVVSNNSKARVQRAVAGLQLPFVYRALKPLPFGIQNALHHWHLQPEDVIMVGDQLVTDMLAASLSGVRSVLVKPIVTSDAWITKGNRWLERFIVAHLKHQDPHMSWQEDLNDRK